MCVRERGRERECVCVCVRERKSVYMWLVYFIWLDNAFGDEAVLLRMFVSVLFISYLKMNLFFAAVLLSCTHV